MAGMNVPMNRTAGQRIGSAAVRAPRLVMSWEDWLTLVAAVICFMAVAASIQQAGWVRNMPSTVPTALAGLLIGMVAARIRIPGIAIHPVAIAIGAMVVLLAVQSYADGTTLFDRIDDSQARLREWWAVVRANDISNDNLPFVALVQSVIFLTAYLASYSIYRWHTPWVAVLPGGLVILANLGFQRGQPSAAFVIFLFGAIVLVSRMHLQRNQAKWRRQGIEYPEFISVSAIQLTVFLTTLLLVAAWLVPLGKQADAVQGVYENVVSPFTARSGRFERLFNNIDSRKGLALHNFGSILPINGNVKLGTKELYEIKAGNAGLVRATSYDVYTGIGWKTGDRDTKKVPGGDLAASPDVAAYEERTVSILQVTVHDSQGTLLTAGMPLGTNKDATIATPGGFAGDIEQLTARRGLNEGDTYNTVGSESKATAEQLMAAGTDYPAWVKDRYLQLPKSLPQRVRDEAKNVAGDASPYVQAQAVETYLRTFPYNLQVEAPPPGRDATDWFLFDLKAGYFDYQATAMTVMLRALGIPARIAVGYVLDTNEVKETTYTVRKDDAYSWVEVYFPKYGWVTFNPTSNKDAGGAGGGFGTGRLDNPGLLGPGDLQDLFGPDPGIVPVGAVSDALKEPPVEHSAPPWTLIWSLVGALVVLATVALAGRISWNWGLGGLDGRARWWAKTQRIAGWAKLGSRPAETPREWSRRLGEAIAVPDATARLADAYEEARYGRPDLQRIDDAEAESSYKRVRNALWSKLFHRKRREPDPERKRRRR
ncbi:MAG: transglutaminase domain-containing protein [Chloroflexi bacterium]|nr:transglutaminase domain-containing protein [Chloroflexota bacterium]